MIETVSAKEQEESRRREVAYRGHAHPLQVSGKTVILVDDGIGDRVNHARSDCRIAETIPLETDSCCANGISINL